MQVTGIHILVFSLKAPASDAVAEKHLINHRGATSATAKYPTVTSIPIPLPSFVSLKRMGQSVAKLASEDTNVQILQHLRGTTRKHNFCGRWTPHHLIPYSKTAWMGRGTLAVSDERIVAYNGNTKLFDALWSTPWAEQIHFELVDSKKIVVTVDAALYGAGASGTMEYRFKIGNHAPALYDRIMRLHHTSRHGRDAPSYVDGFVGQSNRLCVTETDIRGVENVSGHTNFRNMDIPVNFTEYKDVVSWEQSGSLILPTEYVVPNGKTGFGHGVMNNTIQGSMEQPQHYIHTVAAAR